MKKLITLLLLTALAAALFAPAALAESEALPMEGSLVGAMGMPLESWMADEQSHAMFAALAMLDCVLTTDSRVADISTDAMLNDAIYIGATGDSVRCYIFGMNTCLTYTFSMDNVASATLTPMGDATADAMMPILAKQQHLTTFQAVNVQYVLQMMEMLMNVLVQ